MTTEASQLKSRLQEDVKIAMRAQDKAKLGVLRMIMASLKQYEVDTRSILDDEKIIALLDKMLKQRRESSEQYKAAGREELAGKELFEQTIIQNYMPTLLSEEELEMMIKKAIDQVQATTVKDMGKVINLLKPLIQGRADMKMLSDQIKGKLTA
ncbi:GatB/YqeY domain-containing protein [Candidatus Nitrosacidococcus tergens]|uniref:Glutamyl-tRNA amidotransferase n=1 Tax=Candidatus Nitrosacidococcus tergens TaxID=553981 RepID=A0A7G1Q6Z1_9GAMM|nr:GatB/YqeY domain-containing protein [Candidatus Nitrosacidococcus tergens]CAB1274148.1 conserved protein of unknown function [Candidatus Nitrosacidococcus tergens]